MLKQDSLQYLLNDHLLLIAYASIFPESWDKACKYLNEADVKLHVKYQYLNDLVDTEPMTPDEFGKLVSENNKAKGLKLYSNFLLSAKL